MDGSGTAGLITHLSTRLCRRTKWRRPHPRQPPRRSVPPSALRRPKTAWWPRPRRPSRWSTRRSWPWPPGTPPLCRQRRNPLPLPRWGSAPPPPLLPPLPTVFLQWCVHSVRVQRTLSAPVYHILPSTIAVFTYAIGSRKLSANEQFFVGAQTVVSLLQTTQIMDEVLLNVLRCQLTY